MLKDSGDFKKIKNIDKIPEGAILVTDVVGHYPNIPHGAGLEVIRKRRNGKETPRVPTEELMKNGRFRA